jgi:hypothetical protein
VQGNLVEGSKLKKIGSLVAAVVRNEERELRYHRRRWFVGTLCMFMLLVLAPAALVGTGLWIWVTGFSFILIFRFAVFLFLSLNRR